MSTFRAKLAAEMRAEFPEPYQVGQIVLARFTTNSGCVRQFVGRIIGKTKNYWKIESTVSPYEGKAAGRVFHVATVESRIYSHNNRIVEVREPAQ